VEERESGKELLMYVRMTFFKVKDGQMGALRELYNKEVIPAHKKHKGIRFVHLLEGLDDANEGISVTAWDTKADVDAYEKSGDYERLVGMFNAMISGAPVLKSYEVTASSEPIILRLF
jgi:heme-degrading monooxygenase HmoA